LAMVAQAKLVVTTDGMLHHAAAAFGVPAIVLWGGVVSPKILGYPTHINIWNGAQPCGSYAEVCSHCREAMDSISVDQVKKHL
jgi:ADP-heptose:LPS heptosyltransferase